MTRRTFLSAAAAGAVPARSEIPLIVPVHQVLDGRAKCTATQLGDFWSRIWAEADRDFKQCGILLQLSLRTGEIRLSPAGRPIFTGLERGVVNMILTDHIPINWDQGRALAGVTTRYEGYHLSVIALQHAHGHRIPFLSLNTCVHELLHLLLEDVFESRPQGFKGHMREFRIDVYATRLWLFRDGSAIRKAAHSYVERLRRS
jgi:hypothetical protein